MNFINNILNLSKTLQNRILLVFLASTLLFFIIIVSCDDPDNYNLNAGLPQQTYSYRNIDTSTVILHTIMEDTFRTDEFVKDLLGSYFDGVIGKMKVSLFTELQLPAYAITVDASPVLDSVVLRLKYYSSTDYFGFPSFPQTFHVYQLNQRIHKDSVYYSKRKFTYDPVEIGKYSGIFSPSDSGVLSIRLNSAFGNKILNATTDQLNTPEVFADFINGLAIIPDQSNYLGAILYFKLIDTKTCMTVYYNGNKYFSFPINSFSARVSTFENDFSGTAVADQLAQPAKVFETVFMQPLAGLKIRVTIPYLKNLIDSGMIALNNAELVFPVDENSPYFPTLPSCLLLLKADSMNKNYNFIDRYEYYYNSYYNSTRKEYRFGVTRYLQYILKQYGNDPSFKNNFGFNLVIPNDNYYLNTTSAIIYNIGASPVLLKQKNSLNNQLVKLEISYTKLKKNN